MVFPPKGTGNLVDRQYFCDMQLCDINLEDYYFKRGRLPCSSWWLSWPIDGRRTCFIVGLMQQLLNGLYFFFSSGRAHCGLKPENSNLHLSAQLLTLLVLYSAVDGMWKIADPLLISAGTTTEHPTSENERSMQLLSFSFTMTLVSRLTSGHWGAFYSPSAAEALHFRTSNR